MQDKINILENKIDLLSKIAIKNQKLTTKIINTFYIYKTVLDLRKSTSFLSSISSFSNISELIFPLHDFKYVFPCFVLS